MTGGLSRPAKARPVQSRMALPSSRLRPLRDGSLDSREPCLDYVSFSKRLTDGPGFMEAWIRRIKCWVDLNPSDDRGEDLKHKV